MPELTINLSESVYQEFADRANKRELSLEDYIIKTLKYQLKQLKKVEQDLEESRQANLQAQNMINIEPEDEPAAGTD